MSANCYDGLTAEVPAKLGGGKSVAELQIVLSKINNTKTQTAWQGLLNGADYPPLLDTFLAASSPSEAWTMILAWYSPNGETEFEVLSMGDQHPLNGYFSRAHLLVTEMRERRAHKTELETNRHIRGCLSSKSWLVKLVFRCVIV